GISVQPGSFMLAPGATTGFAIAPMTPVDLSSSLIFEASDHLPSGVGITFPSSIPVDVHSVPAADIRDHTGTKTKAPGMLFFIGTEAQADQTVKITIQRAGSGPLYLKADRVTLGDFLKTSLAQNPIQRRDGGTAPLANVAATLTV